jgi:hypothetical protein
MGQAILDTFSLSITSIDVYAICGIRRRIDLTSLGILFRIIFLRSILSMGRGWDKATVRYRVEDQTRILQARARQRAGEGV